VRITGIEGAEVQVKGICNIFNKIITEIFPNLKKVLPIQVQEAFRVPTNFIKIEPTWHITIKTTSTENRKRILKPMREKKQIMYKGKPIQVTADFSTETLKARAWME
jgi:hypothetical protein